MEGEKYHITGVDVTWGKTVKTTAEPDQEWLSAVLINPAILFVYLLETHLARDFFHQEAPAI